MIAPRFVAAGSARPGTRISQPSLVPGERITSMVAWVEPLRRGEVRLHYVSSGSEDFASDAILRVA